MKPIFITGVSSGIGRSIFLHLIDKGVFVIGTVRKTSDLGQFSTFIEQGKCKVLVFDVRDINKCKEQVDSVRPLLEVNGLAVLINNAGIAVPGPLEFLSEEDFELQLDVNVKAVRRITNLLLPYLGVERKYAPGKIINISSISGLFSSPFNGAYSISKYALESMTDVYRRELYPLGIDVIAVEPGPIKTEIWSKNIGSLDKFNNTHYNSFLANADRIIENSEKGAYPVEKVANLLYHIIMHPKPKTRYIVHKKKMLFIILAKVLPDRYVDRLIFKTISKGDSNSPV